MRAVVGRGDLPFVGREHGAQPGLQADIHTSRLAAPLDRMQRPAGRSQWKHGDEQEVEDQFELEAHGSQFRLRADLADTITK
jgi:hypothetical protein